MGSLNKISISARKYVIRSTKNIQQPLNAFFHHSQSYIKYSYFISRHQMGLIRHLQFSQTVLIMLSFVGLFLNPPLTPLLLYHPL